MEEFQRFISKVQKTPSCWLWQGCLRGRSGYGAFRTKSGVKDAHRVSFLLHFGFIPYRTFVCHKCDNRKCVNPDHLFIGTAKDNIRDQIRKGRYVVRKNEHLKKHPSQAAYNKGCRCDGCKEVMKIKRRKLRRIKKSN